MAEARVIPLRGADREEPRRRHGATPGPTAVPDPPVAGTGPGPEAGVASQPGAEAGSQGGSDAAGWERRLADLLAFARRRIQGDYQVDEFGFDPDLTDHVVMPPLRPLYEKWFRVETIGMHNVPGEGGALIVANHSGTLPLDATMTAFAVRADHPKRRHLRMLGADLVFKTPVLGALARKSGQTLACNPDAERLLRSGQLVGVWPEGFKGIGKPFKDRYKLQRFGRGGFVSAALNTGVPIIPCSIVGAEEIYPKIGDIKALARLFGFPYFPVTPFFPLLGPLGAIPLPSKWYIEFGEPIRTDVYGAHAADDPMLVFNLTDQVRETIQQTLYRLLTQRRNVFLG
ncbi:1-acyl-sn-glycerol-3-phosphate acyltransferase [Actinosynnema sp. NPDC004786]